MSRRLGGIALAAAIGSLAVLPVAAAAQDDATTDGVTAAAPTTAAAGKAIAVQGKIALVGTSSTSPNTLVDSGTFSGTPFGSGTTQQTYQLFPKRGVAKVTFSLTNDQGTANGIAYTKFTTTDVTFVFTGAGRITGGTGAYAGMSSGMLQFNAIHSKTGKRERFALVGSASDWGGIGQQQLGAYRTALGVPDAEVLNVNGGTTMVGRPGQNRFSDAGSLRGNPRSTVSSTDTFTSKTTSTTDFTLSAADGTISGTVVAGRSTSGPKMTFNGYGMITSATGAYAGMLNDLVRYRAVYVGGIGRVSYVGSSPDPSKASTVAAIRRFAASIGAPVPPALRG